MFRYQLVSVVTHEGKLDNGHYWACVNSGHEWFQMDDEKGQFATTTSEPNETSINYDVRTDGSSLIYFLV